MPEVIGKLTKAGIEVLVESGAGLGAAFPDAAYADAGAKVVSEADLYGQADVVLRVQKPSAAEVGKLRSGQAVIGLLQPLIDPQTAQAMAEKGVTAISLDAIPRTLSRAQTMDALSSQANVGGYKAVIIAAEAYPRYFPLLTTAAGTAAAPAAKKAAGKTTAKTAAKKTPAKKAAAKKEKAPRAGNLTPSAALQAVIGQGLVSRPEVTKKLWDYIKAQGLQDPKDKRTIRADDKLRAVFGKDSVTMFEIAKVIGPHLS